MNCSKEKSKTTNLNWVAKEREIMIFLDDVELKFNSELYILSNYANRENVVLSQNDFNLFDSIVAFKQGLNKRPATRSYMFVYDSARKSDTIDIFQAIGLSKHSDLPNKWLWFEYFDIKDGNFIKDTSLACVTYPYFCDTEKVIFNYKGHTGDPFAILITCDTSSLDLSLNVKDELRSKLDKMLER